MRRRRSLATGFGTGAGGGYTPPMRTVARAKLGRLVSLLIFPVLLYFVWTKLNPTEEGELRARERALAQAIEATANAQSSLPRTFDDMRGWPSGVVRDASGAPIDPWGLPLSYEPRGDRDYTLSSAGPDGAVGTPDDMVFDHTWVPRQGT